MSDVNVSGSDSGATPTAVAPAQVTATPVTSAAPVVSATPTTPQTQPPATGGAPGEGWVPSYRLREARESAQREANASFAQREAAIRAEADRYKQQLHSIVGVTPPQNPEVTAVRDQFGQLYPGLSKIEERAQQIMELLERSGDLEAQNQHYWDTYGRQTVDKLFTKAAESLGSPLTEEGKRALHSSFVGFVQSSPELQNRYTSDPTLVDEFWRAFTSTFIDPARRSASATVVGRAGSTLPQDVPGGVPNPAAPPKPQNLDERAAAGWALYNLPKG